MALATQQNLQISLDDLYHMISYIYSDKNAERPASVTFSHFVEVCGMLTIHDKKKNREEFSLEDALCKTLAWYFPLLAKLHVKSVQDLLFRKYPNVCPYCRLEVHNEKKCKQAKGTSSTVNHPELRQMFQQNLSKMPKSLNDWQEMFGRIYPRDLKSSGWSTISLFEELGELAEAIRVIETHPKYFAGEAADVFSYIMGIANEYSIRLQADNKPEFNFESEFLKRYPGLCPQCGYQVCICPVIPESTVGRMAKELDLSKIEDLFGLNVKDSENRARDVSMNVLEKCGGLIEVSKQFPFYRGDANRAMVLLCMRLAENIFQKKPEAAKALQNIAIKIGANPKRPGSKTNGEEMDSVITLLKNIWPEISLSIFIGDKSLTGILARQLHIQSCSIGIVTALPKEFAAMRIMFEDSIEYPVPGDPNDYVLGTIPAKDGTGMHLVVLTLSKEMGNNNASSATSNLLRSFSQVKDILMVGIAGGIPMPQDPEKHVRLGDIAVSNGEGVIQYDKISQGIDKIVRRGAGTKPSALMMGKVNYLETLRLSGTFPWESYLTRGEKIENGRRPAESTDKLFIWEKGVPKEIKHPEDSTRRPNMPKIHLGKIGSANNLLKDPLLRDQLRQDLNVIAIEMEGSGIADGTWTHGQQYILIRGICDYCDPKKNDVWQGYAAISAAAYARALLETISVHNIHA